MIDRLKAALAERYRIERELGQGGMATVYLAEDLRHERMVAVKVLRPELAAVVGGERFLGEIRTTAALQHPHILPLHDSGEADGFLFYVMPYVKGETLRERLDRERQLPVDEAVMLARKVADALAYAHEQGIIHRDIKPANILLSRGEPLVADFGIALALSEAGGGRITETGLSLGTPHYMSPEQATGDRSLDPRSDVYALGCVLYEMLAGEPPFQGPTAQAVLSRILTGDPRRVAESRRTVPPHVDAAIARSLEKLPADRFDSAAQFAAALDDPTFTYRAHSAMTAGAAAWSSDDGAGSGTHARWLRVAAVGAAIVLLLAIVAAVTRSGGAPDPTTAAGVLPAHRFSLAGPGEFTPDDAGGIDVAVDGTVAFVHGVGDGSRIMVRFPGEVRARAIEGTGAGVHPTFSPDGQSLAFSVGEELRKVPTRGGPVVTLARAARPAFFFQPHWGPDGTIAVGMPDGLYRVPEVGGIAEQVLEASSPFAARTPFVLPDGRGWLFAQAQASGRAALLDIMHLDPETGETRELATNGSSPSLLATGHLAFVHSSGSLFVAPFHLRRGELRAPPAPVLDSVRYGFFQRTFAASAGGAAIYISGLTSAEGGDGAEVVFMGVAGAETRSPPLPRTDHSDGHFSPDGERLAYTRDDHIWIYHLELGTNLRLTSEGSNHHDPVWSPDGTQIAFGSERDSTGVDIWVKDVDGEAPARLLYAREAIQYPKEWTRDGLLLIQTDHAGNTDLYTMPADGSAPPRPYLRADWDESLPRVSPDERWVAYAANERDVDGVYVRSFPVPGRSHMISEPGVPATEPVWSPDGRTLYYREVGGTNRVIAAEISTDPGLTVVERTEIGTMSGPIRDVHPQTGWVLGFRFGLAELDAADSQLLGVANWFSELRARLGERR